MQHNAKPIVKWPRFGLNSIIYCMNQNHHIRGGHQREGQGRRRRPYTARSNLQTFRKFRRSEYKRILTWNFRKKNNIITYIIFLEFHVKIPSDFLKFQTIFLQDTYSNQECLNKIIYTLSHKSFWNFRLLINGIKID